MIGALEDDGPQTLLGERPIGFPSTLFGVPSAGRAFNIDGVSAEELAPIRERHFAVLGALSCACPCVVVGSSHSKLIRENPVRAPEGMKRDDDADPIKRAEAHFFPWVGLWGAAVCLASAVSCAPLWVVAYRWWVMRVYGIRGSWRRELAKGALCPCCALAQQHEFLSLRHAEGTARYGMWESANGWEVSARSDASPSFKCVVMGTAHVRRRERSPAAEASPASTTTEDDADETASAVAESEPAMDDEAVEFAPAQCATSLPSLLVRALLGLPPPPLSEQPLEREIRAVAVGAVVQATTAPGGAPRVATIELWDSPARPDVGTHEIVAQNTDAVLLAFAPDDRASLDQAIELFLERFPDREGVRAPMVWLVGDLDAETRDIHECEFLDAAKSMARELDAQLVFCTCSTTSSGSQRLLRNLAHELWSRKEASETAA